MEQPKTFLTSAQVAEKVAVPYRKLMRWVEEGLLHPDRVPEHRRPAAKWTAKDVREANVIVQLRQRGVPLQRIHQAMDYLRSLGHNPFSSGQFLVLGDPTRDSGFVKVCETGEVIDLVSHGQLVLPLFETLPTDTLPRASDAAGADAAART